MKKYRFRIKQGASLILLACLVMTPAFCEAEVTSEQIQEQNEKIDNLKEQQQQAEEQVDALEDQKSSLESKLSGLNTKLTDISSSIEDLDAQMTDKEAEIDQAEEDLQAAQDTADEQYESMKLRIQYIYENSTQSSFVALLEAESLTDFLNRVDYIRQISEYDRNMLEQYQQVTEEIETKKAALEEDRQALAALQEETEQKKSEISSLISNTQTDISASAASLADAQSTSEALQAQLDEEIAYEKQLEQQKANEDAARLAEIARQQAENTGANVVIDSESDYALLAALIYCEAGGESYEGQVAVGSVVMNRVKSAYYPNTVSGVIYQGGQFSPVASGRLATVLGNGLTTDSCRQAAAQVLAGNTTNNFLYFRRNDISFSFPVTVIGNHAFY